MRTRRRATVVATALLGLVLAACAAPTSSDTPGAAGSTSASPTEPAAATSATGPSAAESSATETSASAEPAPEPGRYVDLADYRKDEAAFHDGDVVLFFNATWCPTCQEATTNLTADPKALGKGVTVVSVDYDENTDLRRKYGVTYQHTFVQIDENGEKIKVWSGSSTPAEVAAKLA
jgi:thiol-disulfide isomerase/thioredoxin